MSELDVEESFEAGDAGIEVLAYSFGRALEVECLRRRHKVFRVPLACIGDSAAYASFTRDLARAAVARDLEVSLSCFDTRIIRTPS